MRHEVPQSVSLTWTVPRSVPLTWAVPPAAGRRARVLLPRRQRVRFAPAIAAAAAAQ